MAKDKPNIIYILMDDLGYGDLGCYGQKVMKTPNIDAMASEGVKFTQHYSGSTVCAPSRCCLMTGLHTGHARVRGNSPRLPLEPEDTTVAEALKGAGYATGIFGKWGIGEPGTKGVPNKKGFDEWFGYLNQGRAHNYYPEYLWDNEEQYWIKENMEGKRGVYSHNLFTERGLDFIKRNKDNPFFLYMAYTLPHANNELTKETGDGMEVPDYGAYSDKPWSLPEKGFAAMVEMMDRDAGRIMSLLKELGIDDDTVLFFTSDNGPHKEGGHDANFFESSGPLRGIKRDMYEGGIRVPMIARWPGKIEAGAVSDQVWSFWDFLPTAADIAGANPPKDIDGISMLPALLGQPQQDPEYLYWEYQLSSFHQAVRMGDWKGVRRSLNKSIELYNLRDDIHEQNNIADDHADVVEQIAHIMRAAHTDSPDFPVKEQS